MMRYAIVNDQGKIQTIFLTTPDMVEHRHTKPNEQIVECPVGTVDDSYYDGNNIVEKQPIMIQYSIVGNKVSLYDLPTDTNIRIIGGNGLDVLTVSGNTEITLSSGMNLLEIDPWPHLHTRIVAYVE